MTTDLIGGATGRPADELEQRAARQRSWREYDQACADYAASIRTGLGPVGDVATTCGMRCEAHAGDRPPTPPDGTPSAHGDDRRFWLATCPTCGATGTVYAPTEEIAALRRAGGPWCAQHRPADLDLDDTPPPAGGRAMST